MFLFHCSVKIKRSQSAHDVCVQWKTAGIKLITMSAFSPLLPTTAQQLTGFEQNVSRLDFSCRGLSLCDFHYADSHADSTLCATSLSCLQGAAKLKADNTKESKWDVCAVLTPGSFACLWVNINGRNKHLNLLNKPFKRQNMTHLLKGMQIMT